MNILKKYRYDIIDLDCAACAKEVEEAINEIKGIQNCIVNFGTGKITLESELENTLEEIKKVAAKVEPDCTIKLPEEDKRERKDYGIIRLIIGIILAVIGFSKIIPNEIVSAIFIIGAYGILLYRTFIKAIKQIKGKIIDENLFMVIYSIGAYLIGERLEGLGGMTLLKKVCPCRWALRFQKSLPSLKSVSSTETETKPSSTSNSCETVRRIFSESTRFASSECPGMVWIVTWGMNLTFFPLFDHRIFCPSHAEIPPSENDCLHDPVKEHCRPYADQSKIKEVTDQISHQNATYDHGGHAYQHWKLCVARSTECDRQCISQRPDNFHHSMGNYQYPHQFCCFCGQIINSHNDRH